MNSNLDKASKNLKTFKQLIKISKVDSDKNSIVHENNFVLFVSAAQGRMDFFQDNFCFGSEGSKKHSIKQFNRRFMNTIRFKSAKSPCTEKRVKGNTTSFAFLPQRAKVVKPHQEFRGSPICLISSCLKDLKNLREKNLSPRLVTSLAVQIALETKQMLDHNFDSLGALVIVFKKPFLVQASELRCAYSVLKNNRLEPGFSNLQMLTHHFKFISQRLVVNKILRLVKNRCLAFKNSF